jgi:hypothetical protein
MSYPGFDSLQEQEVFSETFHNCSGALSVSYSVVAGVLSRDSNGRVKLTIHLRPERRLRMNTAVHLLALYAFMALTGTNEPLAFMSKKPNGSIYMSL